MQHSVIERFMKKMLLSRFWFVVIELFIIDNVETWYLLKWIDVYYYLAN